MDAGELAVRRALGSTPLIQHAEAEDVPEGEEPGAGRGIMLVQTDSYDDIAAFLHTPEGETKPSTIYRRSSKPLNDRSDVDVAKEQDGEEEKDSSDAREDDAESEDSIIRRVDANIHRINTIASLEVDEDDDPVQPQASAQEDDDNITIGATTRDNFLPASVSQSFSDSTTTSPSNETSEISDSTTPSTAPQSPSRARAVPPVIQTQSSVTSEVFEGGQDAESCVRESWRRHRKHIFILSSAGKPIYTRYGDEADQASIIGVLQALFMSYEHSEDREKDSLVSIVAGKHRFVFLFREPLLFVCVSSGSEPTHQLRHQLVYAYYQIVFNLTSARIEQYFKQRTNYDLRRQLTGLDRFTDALMDSCDYDTSFLVGAVRALALDGSIRDTVAQTVVQYCKIKGLVFAIMFAVDPESNSSPDGINSSFSGNIGGGITRDQPINSLTESTCSISSRKNTTGQLITIVRHRSYFLHPIELHLLFNLVTVTGAFKGQENWVPVCLPKFSSSGFLYAHVSYLNEQCDTCLILMTVESGGFQEMSQAKAQIQQKLIQLKCLDAISASIKRGPYNIRSVDVSEMRHFVYKSRSTSLCTSPALAPPYLKISNQSRLMSLYRYVHHRTHMPLNSGASPLRLLLVRGAAETCVSWMTRGFEVYAVFGPLVSKQEAIAGLNRLMRWMKKEEDKLFILNSLVLPVI